MLNGVNDTKAWASVVLLAILGAPCSEQVAMSTIQCNAFVEISMPIMGTLHSVGFDTYPRPSCFNLYT